MLYVVIIYLWTAILLYLLLAGADFGAGIIEFFTSKAQKKSTRKTIYKTIGPIWEANHMWLIITIVILFVGFPQIYSTISVALHIPLTIMLFGIIARGTAFTFRYYDAVVDRMQQVYTHVFEYSSFLTPLFLGIIAASTVSGQIDPNAHSFLSAYIFSWLSWFSVSVGVFTVAICGYLAAMYLTSEAGSDAEKKRYIRKAQITGIAALLCGAFVFVAASAEGIPLFDWMFGNVVGVTAMSAAALSLLFLQYFLKKGRTKILRLLAGFQVTMILLTITYRHYPNIVLLKNGGYLSLLDHSGQEKSIDALALALLIGSIFILPALFYLIYSFQKKNLERD